MHIDFFGLLINISIFFQNKESDSPESAVAKLLGNAKKHDFQLSYFGGQTSCLQNLPSEVQIQVCIIYLLERLLLVLLLSLKRMLFFG